MTLPALSPLAWAALLHPVVVILFVYPVVGATIRLGILVREQRLGITQQPALVPVEHADHGRSVTTGVVVAVLIALVWCFAAAWLDPLRGLTGGPLRLLQLALVAAAALASCLLLWRVKHPALRACFGLLAWAALLSLGTQPEIPRLSDNPFQADFWRSHGWSGLLLSGLLLFSMAAKPEIQASPRMRRLHVALAFLVALLLAVQAITGSRDLLALGLGG